MNNTQFKNTHTQIVKICAQIKNTHGYINNYIHKSRSTHTKIKNYTHISQWVYFLSILPPSHKSSSSATGTSPLLPNRKPTSAPMRQLWTLEEEQHLSAAAHPSSLESVCCSATRGWTPSVRVVPPVPRSLLLVSPLSWCAPRTVSEDLEGGREGRFSRAMWTEEDRGDRPWKSLHLRSSLKSPKGNSDRRDGTEEVSKTSCRKEIEELLCRMCELFLLWTLDHKNTLSCSWSWFFCSKPGPEGALCGYVIPSVSSCLEKRLWQIVLHNKWVNSSSRCDGCSLESSLSCSTAEDVGRISQFCV